ncbi:MAG TPA: bifunctional [glutamate--ammonia ligase]-adenylyl-L-tyrosine phosphorylase/[glutamate--ammonia-ligase] adenylyltransferase [Casimicrobiaceae bacterium]|nr:bifunctional [glutamate--ammonia ligase]-adenylyl-L-tyrosine phosphorylase/[glutamate--ammonia-ligase] adenylyltransferase [Casimicrobiaceae bacterium]
MSLIRPRLSVLSPLIPDFWFAFSRYAQRVCAAWPELAQRVRERLGEPFSWDEPLQALAASTSGASLAAGMRQTRAALMLHTLARDLAGRADLGEVVAGVTRLAETCLDAAVRVHHRELTETFGEPYGAQSGMPQSLIVVGMGKLGGAELNVSSDVDLVFVYPEEGETQGARKLANADFFARLGRRVIGALNDVTEDGFVFRVDMRLRPYGDAGPLAVSYASLEQYLISQGRTWERYAWLKARPLTGRAHDGLTALVTPFVFRKYLDYDAYDGLRDVHRQIREQGVRRDYRDDIKLGHGGIREIEFTVQALQIVRGGREPTLRVRGTLPAIDALVARRLLPSQAAASLRDAYTFLRRLEHRLQYRDDQQTHALPADASERELLAQSLALTPAEFERKLTQVRDTVREQFEVVLGAPAESPPSAMRAVWDDPSSDAAPHQLVKAGYVDANAIRTRLAGVRSSGRYLQLPPHSRERFDALVPRLLEVASTESTSRVDPASLFARLLELVVTVSRRSAYLALLIEHPPLLPRIAALMAASAWAADYLVRHPILLDELLDARVDAGDETAWRAELANTLAAAGDDAERRMDALRHFKHAQTFRLLVQDLNGALTVERLADHLSAVADIVLEATLSSVWAATRGARSGAPEFAIIGYGKLGGKELGYASDLDLVFLYDVGSHRFDADAMPAVYARLAQRLNTWLTSTTSAGQLYDTDLRLRPDGASGLIVSSLAAFRRYQRQSAWTWEHQALTRARYVAGDAAIGVAFEGERESILRLPRDAGKLAADVIDMRRRMDAGHPNPGPLFDLKHDPGGMVDIEFAVQYLVLAHSASHATLTRNAGNIALLQHAGKLGLVPMDVAIRVADAYREFRREQHAVRLTGANEARVERRAHGDARASVDALWRHLFGSPWR